MVSDTEDLDRLVGMGVFLRIHDQIGPGIRLIKDPLDGYLYRGVFVGEVLFEDGDVERHLAIALSRPIFHQGKDGHEHRIDQILATTRYQGDAMSDILDGKMLTTSFSSIVNIVFQGPSPSNLERRTKEMFGTDDFIWIGVGELSIRRPEKPFLEAPWEIAESSL